MILGENNEKMSKSRGNVVNPDDVIRDYGADTLRLYEMFIGDFEKAAPWNTNSIKGCKRFLDRVWALQDIISGEGISPDLEAGFHKCIKKVGEDADSLKANTAIAAMMTLLNDITATGSITKDEYEIFITLLNPFAPHITEEIWEILGHDELLCKQSWPQYDESKCVEATVEMVVQICGKIKARMNVAADADKDTCIAAAKEAAAAELEGKTILKEICVPGKLVNFVAK